MRARYLPLYNVTGCSLTRLPGRALIRTHLAVAQTQNQSKPAKRSRHRHPFPIRSRICSLRSLEPSAGLLVSAIDKFARPGRRWLYYGPPQNARRSRPASRHVGLRVVARPTKNQGVSMRPLGKNIQGAKFQAAEILVDRNELVPQVGLTPVADEKEWERAEIRDDQHGILHDLR